jgi:hypothetical protein
MYIEKLFCHTDEALFGWLGKVPAETGSCISAYVGFLNSQRFFPFSKHKIPL